MDREIKRVRIVVEFEMESHELEVGIRVIGSKKCGEFTREHLEQE